MEKTSLGLTKLSNIASLASLKTEGFGNPKQAQYERTA
jgi:hypothetical protein